jgi:hypothetical protein
MKCFNRAVPYQQLALPIFPTKELLGAPNFDNRLPILHSFEYLNRDDTMPAFHSRQNKDLLVYVIN